MFFLKKFVAGGTLWLCYGRQNFLSIGQEGVVCRQVVKPVPFQFPRISRGGCWLVPASLVLWEHPALGMVVSVVGWLYSTACLKFYNMANIFKTSFFRAENKLVREIYIYTHIFFSPFSLV